MKKGILFAGGVALTLAFAGCDDGSAKIAELQAELDKATKNVSKQPSAKKEASRRVTAPKAAPPPTTRVQDVPKPLAAKEPSQKENEINDCILSFE